MSPKKRNKTPSPASKGKANAPASSLTAAPKRSRERSEGSRRSAKPLPPRPPEVDSVFSPVEIEFFERAADLYAEQYDVWDDFRPPALN